MKLDAGGNQLYVALDGYGVYATIAPHRLRDARVVSAADYSSQAGGAGRAAERSGSARGIGAQRQHMAVPVLDASDSASQIQVPFEAKGTSVSLSLEAAAGPIDAWRCHCKAFRPRSSWIRKARR